jgi:hypothetical protein
VKALRLFQQKMIGRNAPTVEDRIRILENRASELDAATVLVDQLRKERDDLWFWAEAKLAHMEQRALAAETQMADMNEELQRHRLSKLLPDQGDGVE